MGFDDKDIVALSGAHALGRCHKDRSGFDGPWSFSPITFSVRRTWAHLLCNVICVFLTDDVSSLHIVTFAVADISNNVECESLSFVEFQLTTLLCFVVVSH